MVNALVFFATSSINRRISAGPNAQLRPRLNSSYFHLHLNKKDSNIITIRDQHETY